MARGATGLLALLLCAAGSTRAQARVEFSENPVRSDQVVISWPTPAGDSRLEIYTLTGERIFTTTVAAPSNEYVWDLTLGGGGTRRVVNGAYIVVVGGGGSTQTYRRRLFIDRPAQ